MAFCTNCGANVAGAFCQQCGTPAKAAAPAAPAAAPGGAAPPPLGAQPLPGAAVPMKRKTSPIVWVLVIVLGFFVICGLAVVGTGLFVVHKAREAGIDAELFQKNPGVAITKMLTAFNPEVEVVRADNNAGTITIRERKTGKEVTMTFDQAKSGKVTFSAQDDNGKTATIEIGGSSSKLPSWIPAYPGAQIQANISARGDSGDGTGEGGNFSYTTSDSVAGVLAFYQTKARDLGMKVGLNASTGDGGTLVIADDDSKRSLTVIAGRDASTTTVNVTYGAKR